MAITDIHSHLLPGVDDGVSSRDESEALLVQYHAAGITRIICTPHLNNPYVRTRILAIRDAYLWFSETALKYGIQAELGSELYITPQKYKFIPFLDRFLLVETPLRVEPLFLLDRIFEFQLQGFTVIMAHVERFSWMTPESPAAVRMREMGVLFQVNIQGVEDGSALPYMDADMVDFIASDNHGAARRNPVHLGIFARFPDIVARSEELLEL